MNDETPTTAKKYTPEGQLSLTEILDEIEREAKNDTELCQYARDTLLRVVKALRRALLQFTHPGSANWRAASDTQARKEIAQLLRKEPEKKQDLEEPRGT